MGFFSLDSVLIGLHTLRSNPLRTMLSTLGIIIGVASLVAVLSLGDSLEEFSRQQIIQTTDLQTISITPSITQQVNGIRVRRKDVASFTIDDIEDLTSVVGSAGRVTLTLTRSDWISLDDDSTGQAMLIVATLPGAIEAMAFEVAFGKFFERVDVTESGAVAVLSAAAAELLDADEGGSGLIGRTVRAGNIDHEIIGVLAPMARKAPPSVILPYGATNKAWMEDDAHTALALIRANRLEDVTPLRTEIGGWLQSRFPDSGARFTVASSQRMVEQAAQGMMVFKLALGSIAGISLLVGGIGIMNILLASVTERTREIGIRRATGAKRGHILMQFLAESVAISAAGSTVGVIVGVGGAFLITAIIQRITEAPIDAVFRWSTVLFAAAVATLVGLIFGTYPARRASKIEPAEAVRHE